MGAGGGECFDRQTGSSSKMTVEWTPEGTCHWRIRVYRFARYRRLKFILLLSIIPIVAFNAVRPVWAAAAAAGAESGEDDKLQELTDGHNRTNKREILTTNLSESDNLARGIEMNTSGGGGGGGDLVGKLDEESMKFPLYMRFLATMACLIIFTIGVSGNFLVPLVVIKTKYLRNSTNLFLINLSMADLLLLIVSMPTVLIELHSRPETWLLGEPMCKLSNFVEMLAANGSIFTILAISFERYYAICKPLKAGYKCTRLRATIIICLIWLLSIILTSPILIMAKSSETTYLDNSLVYNCILETDTYWTKMYVIISMFAFFCLPLLVLMFVYWLISRRLIRENLAMSTTTTTTTAATSLATTSCEISTSDSFASSTRKSAPRKSNASSQLILTAISIKQRMSLKKANSLKSFVKPGQSSHAFVDKPECESIHFRNCRAKKAFSFDQNISLSTHLESGLTTPNCTETERLQSSSGTRAEEKRTSCESLLALRLKFASTFLSRLFNMRTFPPRSFGLQTDNQQDNQYKQVLHIHPESAQELDASGGENASGAGSKGTSFSGMIMMDSISEQQQSTFKEKLKTNQQQQRELDNSPTLEIDDRSVGAATAAGKPFLVERDVRGEADEGGQRRSERRRKRSSRKERPATLLSQEFPGEFSETGSKQNTDGADNKSELYCPKRRSSLSSNVSESNTLPSTATTSAAAEESVVSQPPSSGALVGGVKWEADCFAISTPTNRLRHEKGPRPILHRSSHCNSSSNSSPDKQQTEESKKSARFHVVDAAEVSSFPNNSVNNKHHLENNSEEVNLGSSSLSCATTTPTSSPTPSSRISPFSSKSTSPDSTQSGAGSGAETGYSGKLANKAIILAKAGERSSSLLASLDERTRLINIDRNNYLGGGKNTFLILEEETNQDDELQRANGGPPIAKNKDERLKEVILHKKFDSSKSTPSNKNQSGSFYHHLNFTKIHQSLNSSKIGHHHHGKLRSGSQPSVSSLANNNNNNHHHHHQHLSELLVVQDLSKKQQMDSRRQVVVMLAFVVACFFLLFFPYRVFTIWLILSTEDQVKSLGMETYYNLTYFSRILVYLHSAINPIAYNLISTKFRRAFMSILLCRGSSTRRKFVNEHRMLPQHLNHSNNSRKVSRDEFDQRRSLRQTDRQFTR